MSRIRSLLFILTLLMIFMLPAVHGSSMIHANRVNISKFEWTASEASWIQDHVGIIFYGEGAEPFYTTNELIDLAHYLGVRKVKTWLKGSHWGHMEEKLHTPEYKRVLSEFDTVLFDVCPDFMHKGAYDTAKSKGIHDDYEKVAYHLASNYRDQKKTFLLSLFMETNLFFGTQRAHVPDFPVDRFFKDATQGIRDGVKRAKEEKIAGDIPDIYVVIEIAGRPKDFIERYLPETSADLYAISYYGRGELGQPDVTLKDCIQTLSRVVPHNGPFGKNNIILGELGRNVFQGGNYGEDKEQLEYLRKTLGTAREFKMPYAFIFWLTDQERHLDDGWGFISSKKTGGQCRRSWFAFQSAFNGKMPAPPLPSKSNPTIDAVRVVGYNPEPGTRTAIEIDVANRCTWNTTAAPAGGLKVSVSAGQDNQGTRISIAPNEIVTLKAEVIAPQDGEVVIEIDGPGLEAVERTISLNRADIVVDKVYMEPESPKAGDDVRLFAVCRNIGKKPITDFSVQFHVDDFKDLWVTWGCIYGQTILEPGKTIPIGGGFLWKATPGKHKIRAWANADGSRESRLDNNIGYTSIKVR